MGGQGRAKGFSGFGFKGSQFVHGGLCGFRLLLPNMTTGRPAGRALSLQTARPHLARAIWHLSKHRKDLALLLVSSSR
jgi:hypothetical protein